MVDPADCVRLAHTTGPGVQEEIISLRTDGYCIPLRILLTYN